MPLSPIAKQAMFSQQSEEVLITLLTITHPSTPGTWLVSNDPTVRVSDDPLLYATYSRGQQFVFIPFSLVLPESSDESPPSAKIVLTNVERELIPLLRTYHQPATIMIEMVLSSNPDAVEVPLTDLQVLNCTYSAEEVVLALGAPLLSIEPFPALSFSPGFFAGLFRSILITLATLGGLAELWG
jgi:Domain of unknown function (DUF1833)